MIRRRCTRRRLRDDKTAVDHRSNPAAPRPSDTGRVTRDASTRRSWSSSRHGCCQRSKQRRLGLVHLFAGPWRVRARRSEPNMQWTRATWRGQLTWSKYSSSASLFSPQYAGRSLSTGNLSQPSINYWYSTLNYSVYITKFNCYLETVRRQIVVVLHATRHRIPSTYKMLIELQTASPNLFSCSLSYQSAPFVMPPSNTSPGSHAWPSLLMRECAVEKALARNLKVASSGDSTHLK